MWSNSNMIVDRMIIDVCDVILVMSFVWVGILTHPHFTTAHVPKNCLKAEKCHQNKSVTQFKHLINYIILFRMFITPTTLTINLCRSLMCGTSRVMALGTIQVCLYTEHICIIVSSSSFHCNKRCTFFFGCYS